VNGNILNSKGVHVAVVRGHEVFDLKGQKLYDLRGVNIYKLNGDLVGHLSLSIGAAYSSEMYLGPIEQAEAHYSAAGRN
jgi:hypothetical protein